MPVPSSLADLSTTASSNSPAGTDSIGTSLDDYLRSTQALLKQSLSRGTDIASAATITIPANGNYCVVTGTTTISSIADSWNGRVVTLRFSDSLTLTNSASLILPGGVSLLVVAGDCVQLVNESTGVWRCFTVGNASGTVIFNDVGTGSKTAFTLASAPQNENYTNVYINGVYQQKNSYSVSGVTLTFSEAPPVNSSIEVNYV